MKLIRLLPTAAVLLATVALATKSFAQAPAPAAATAPAPAPAAPPAPPAPPEARQFDFWVGEWEVFGPAGKKIGVNKIELVAGGYGLLENWNDVRGGSGKSLNTYKRRTKQWQQYWIGSNGQTVEYRGGMVDGKMVMTAEVADLQGNISLTRGIWTPNPDGTVTQIFENSTDQGLTWTAVFSGTYRKAPSTP